MSLRRVISLRGVPLVQEIVASVAITPGMLIEQASDGTVKPHATAAGEAPRTFGMERDEAGDDIDVPYAIGDQVKVGAYYQGCEVLAIIASGQNITVGNFLESAGNGKLRVFSAGVKLGVATESVNNSAGPGDARLSVRLI